jgi:4-diphosphocytidyl-2-C-methyl-D-erythritol kinase
MTVEAFAPAKVNLALHVTGQRADGYHLLDSFVVFASVGDRIIAAPSDRLSLTIEGPEGHHLDAGPDNLVLHAARSLGSDRGAAITLEKVLPVSSGMGGGSADAAATLKSLSQLWDQPLPDTDTVLRIGADVPVCLAGRPARMSGIGERLDPVPALPDGTALLLVNPRVGVPTAKVFAALACKNNPPLAPFPDRFETVEALTDWLTAQRNDLEAPALTIAPVIGEVLAEIGAADCLMARMSGSGATCYGLFAGLSAARDAVQRLGRLRPDWWVRAASILPHPQG